MLKYSTVIISCFWLATPTTALSQTKDGCGLLSLWSCPVETSEEVKGLEQLSARRLVDAFKSGSKFCNRPDFSNASCALVQSLQSVNRDGITLSVLGGLPYTYKVKGIIRLTVKDDQLCHSSSDFIESMTWYDTIDDKAEISPYDAIASTDRQTSNRQNALAQIERDREHCYSYYFLEPLSEGSDKKIIMDSYLDGILQPFDDDATAVLFSEDIELTLRASK